MTPCKWTRERYRMWKGPDIVDTKIREIYEFSSSYSRWKGPDILDTKIRKIYEFSPSYVPTGPL